MIVVHNEKALEKATIVGDSPVSVNQQQSSSRAGHVQSCLNMGRPRSKPKYSLPTDSELVPWGKGKKNPVKGSEIDLKPDAYKQ